MADEIKKEVSNNELAEMIQGEFSRIDSNFGKMDERFERMDNRLSKMDERFENIENKMVTRDEFITANDKMMIILQRLDQERVFTLERVRNLEKDVEQIKTQLKIA